MGDLQAHFVTFFSPGTFVAEETQRPIPAWDVDLALEAAAFVRERHGAQPYGFRFTTRGRGPDDLDSKVIATSPMYYINCRVETLAEVEARADPSERILLSNMKGNGYDRIVKTVEGWGWSAPLRDGDVVLEARQ